MPLEKEIKISFLLMSDIVGDYLIGTYELPIIFEYMPLQVKKQNIFFSNRKLLEFQ